MAGWPLSGLFCRPKELTKLGVAAEKQQAHAHSLIFSSETIDTSLRRIVANYYSHQDTVLGLLVRRRLSPT